MNYLKLHLLCFIIGFIIPSLLHAQINQNDTLGRYQYKHRMDTLYFKQDAIKVSYFYNGGHGISLGYNVSKLNYSMDMPIPTNRIGPTISMGGYVNSNDVYLTTGIAASAHLFLLYASIESNWYTNFQKSAVYITPEMGISLIGLIYLGYSRNLKVTDNCQLKLKGQANFGVFLPLANSKRKHYVNGQRKISLDKKR